MLRTRLAVLSMVLMGCPSAGQDTDTSLTTTGTATTTGAGSASGGDLPDSTTSSGESQTSETLGVALTTLESTGSSTEADLAPDLSCKPTPLFCQQFNSWCPFATDQGSCDAVATTCENQTSLCSLCADVRDACHKAWGAESPLCDLGYTKCLAVDLVEGCGCQPAVFPCAGSESDCKPGWLYQPGGGYCAPPCTDAAPFMGSTGGEATTGFDASGSTGSTSGDVVTDGTTVDGSTTTEDTSSTGSTGDAPVGAPPDSSCGPANYATCEMGHCTPHVLLFCL